MYTNHIAWSLSTTGCVYQSYCLVSQYYWLCIPIILLGLSVVLVVYTNHIDWYTQPETCNMLVYQSYCLVVYTNHIAWSHSTTGCVYQSYCLVSPVLLVVYTNHIAWLVYTTSTTGWEYQSYCLVVYTNHIVWSTGYTNHIAQYYWSVYTNHIVWLCIPIILFGLWVYTNHIAWSTHSTTGVCIPIILLLKQYWLCIPIILLETQAILIGCVYQSYCLVYSVLLVVYTNHIAWSLSTTGSVYTNHIDWLLLGLSVVLVEYTNHIAWSTQYYWLCIPIILIGLSVVLVVYINHIAWSLSTTGCVYQSYCLVSQVYTNHIVLCTNQYYFGRPISTTWSVYTNHIAWFKQYCCVYQSYCLVSQCIPIILLGLWYTNHITWSHSTTGCVYQSYCLVDSVLMVVYTNHITWSLSTTGVVYTNHIAWSLNHILVVYTNHIAGLQGILVVYTNHIAWSLSTTGSVYTNHIDWLCIPISSIGCVYQSYCLVSHSTTGVCIPIILIGCVYQSLLVVYTNHIAWSLSTTGCVYQSYCLVSQYYWLCIPIILLGLLSTTGCVYQSYWLVCINPVLLVVYTNHIAWSAQYTNHIDWLCIHNQYYWLCIPIILIGLTEYQSYGCVYQSYCLVDSVLLVVYTNHIAWSL